MLHTILMALTPIVFVTFLGWLSARLEIVAKDKAGVIADFVVRFALPLSLFLAAAKATPADLTNVGYVASLAVGLFGTWLLGMLIGKFVFGHDLPSSVIQGIACGFPNMAYCGPPLLNAAIGPEALLAVLVGNLIVTIFIVPISLVLLHGGKEAHEGQQRSGLKLVAGNVLGAVKQPLVWLPVLGVVLAMSGIKLPDVATGAVDEIGRAAGGAALFALGLILYGVKLRVDSDILVNVGLKNLLQPALIGGTALLVGLPQPLAAQVFLIGTLPSATVVAVLSLQYRAYTEEASVVVLVSTLFSIVTMVAGIVIVQAF